MGGSLVEPDCDSTRPKRMRNAPTRLLALGASGLLSLATACGAPSNAHDPSSTASSTSNPNSFSNTSCVGPYLNDQPPSGSFRLPEQTVSPGATINIYGHWYTSTCNDTGRKAPLEPLPPVHLTLKLPSGVLQNLGEFHPNGQDMGFSLEVHVPAATPAGTATVHDDRQFPAAYTFQVGH